MNKQTISRAILIGCAGLLNLSATAAAMQLRLGDVWTWNVRSLDKPSMIYCRATPFDTIRVDQGLLWKIGVSSADTNGTDQLNFKPLDTATILERPNGRQYWLIRSSLLRIELQPYSKAYDVTYKVGSDSTYKWGEVLCPGSLAIKSSVLTQNPHPESFNNDLGMITYQFWDRSMSYISTERVSFPISKGKWMDPLAYQGFRTFIPNNSQLWTLFTYNRDTFPDTFQVKFCPQKVGSTISWKNQTHRMARDYKSSLGSINSTADQTTTNIISWKILARLPDSSNIATHIIQMHSTNSNQITFSTYESHIGQNDSTSLDTSIKILDDSATIEFNLKTDLLTGAGTGDLPGILKYIRPDWSWNFNWFDETSPTNRFPASNTETRFAAFKENTLDSGFYQETPTSSSTTYVSYYSFESNSISHTLKQIESDLVGDTPILTPRIDKNKFSFSQLAQLYPQTLVNWSNLKGAQGTLPASQLAHRTQAPADGLIFLRAQFPNGQSISGSLLNLR